MKAKYKNYTIEVNEYSFDLYEKRTVKKSKYKEKVGTEHNVHIGYYSSLLSVIRKIIHLELSKSNDVVTLREMINEYQRISYATSEAIDV